MAWWWLVACTAAKLDTAETGAVSDTSDTVGTADTSETETAGCTGDEAWLEICVYDAPHKPSARTDAVVYAVPPGEKTAIETVVDADGCVTWPAWAGTWTVWAVSDGGYCTSERVEATVAACETAPVDLYTKAGCVDG